MKIKDRRINISIAVGIIITVILMIIPTGYEDAVIYKDADRVSARVISTNESAVKSSGIIKYGEQTCEIEILGGKFKGETVHAVNMLQGSLDSDKIFAPGDKALVVVSYLDSKILSILMIDHYRLNMEIILAAVFVLLLMLLAGKTGARAMLSFIITVLAIWKILVMRSLEIVRLDIFLNS